jgi:type IV pilus assembly protein PilY1
MNLKANSYLLKLNKVLTRIFFLAVYIFASIQSSWADDTEIFFASSQNKTVTPNVLFIFDTSGSMNRRASGDSGGADRIDVMRDVMTEFMTDISNLNIGMSRFSVPGGPILNGVVDVDAPADPIATATINSDDDDATEKRLGNKVTYNAENLEFNRANETDLLGLRFNDLDIPQGATITKATIIFSTYTSTSGEANLSIAAESVGDSAAFTGTKLSTRLQTAARVAWTPEDWNAPSADPNGDPVPPNTYSTPDLSDVVQEVVNQTDWCGGNSMAFFVADNTGISAIRSAIAHEQSGLYAPRIRIEYDTTLPAGANGCFVNRAVSQIAESEHDFEVTSGLNLNSSSGDLDFYNRGNGRTNHGVGLHFSSVNVPNGATIENAYLEITADNDNNGKAELNIQTVNSSDASASPSDIFYSPKLAGVFWSLPTFVDNVVYQTPTLKTQIETLVNKGAWQSGNAE